MPVRIIAKVLTRLQTTSDQYKDTDIDKIVKFVSQI